MKLSGRQPEKRRKTEDRLGRAVFRVLAALEIVMLDPSMPRFVYRRMTMYLLPGGVDAFGCIPEYPVNAVMSGCCASRHSL